MKKNITQFCAILLLMIGAVVLFNCENDHPKSLYDPNTAYNVNPVITNVSPAQAFAGIDTITITGENFSAVSEENFVYFSGNKATIVAATPTMIKVQAPNVVADSMILKVSVTGALLFAEYSPVKLELATIEYGAFGDFDDVSSITVDNEENVYLLSATKKVIKVTPNGDKTDYGTTAFFIASGMKMGPGGYLYIARGNTQIWRIPPAGGAAVKFATVKATVKDLDFDANGILFAAGKDTVYSVKPDGSFLAAAPYPSSNLISVRVYNGFLYVAAEYSGTDPGIVEEAIWRNQIIGTDGQLGDRELVFNWSNYAGEIASPAMMCITFAENGDLLIGQDKDNAITIYTPATNSTRYLYPGVVFPPTTAMCWGTSRYLYVNRHNNEDATQRRVMRYTMKTNGAPYHGRTL